MTRFDRFLAIAAAATALAASSAAAQDRRAGAQPADEHYPTRWSPRTASAPAVRDALAWIETNFPAQVQEWVRTPPIPAQSPHEQQRAASISEQMRAEGLEVSIDSIGNVTGRRRGEGGGPTIVFAPHMDTVHPMDADVTVRVDGGILRAPGVFDNSASVADMLAVVRALNRAHVRTRGDLVVVATVQEELGLRGMDWWLAHNPRPDMVVAVDGGLGPVSYGALGIYWTRYHFSGEGSHTNSSTGKPHPRRGDGGDAARPPRPSAGADRAGRAPLPGHPHARGGQWVHGFEHGGDARHPLHLRGPRTRGRPAHAQRVGRARHRAARHENAPAAGGEPGGVAVIWPGE